jgi:hypothetical protein
MEQVIKNIVQSKAPLMVVLRYLLIGAVILMGLARLRIILILLFSPETYTGRDILQEYLMAKAVVSGVNPYLPLDELAQMFVGKISFLNHPAPYPPFISIISIPLTWLSLKYSIISWYFFEMICLMAISVMLILLWKGKIDWIRAIILFFFLLAWYPIMVELLFGQLTILVTTLVLAALLAAKKNRKVLAGVLIGLSVAIKVFTWPLIVYFAIKKDWRMGIPGCLTIIGLNLTALFVIGLGPMMDYYFHVMMQVSAVYHSFLKNYSLWSIGYRFFEGTGPMGDGYVSAPPLINLPQIAPYVSAGLAIAFLVIGLIWAVRCKDLDIAYSIMICVLIAISPIAWDHYYVMLIISLVVLLHELSKQSFPTWPTFIFMIISLSFFLINDHIDATILLLNGGGLQKGTGYQITFASSLLEVIPILELIVLTILLWQRGIAKE